MNTQTDSLLSRIAVQFPSSDLGLQKTGTFSLDSGVVPVKRFTLSSAAGAHRLSCRRPQRVFASITGPDFTLPKFSLPDFSSVNLPWLKKESMSTQRVDLSGTWMKDGAKSDGLEEAMNLIQLGVLLRQACRLIRGMDIKQTDEYFEFALFSVIPWFKVTERYPLDGGVAEAKRRDLRSGQHKGSVELTSEKAIITLEWSDPLGGTGVDEFYFSGENELSVRSSIKVGDRSAAYTQVYRRK